VTPGAAAGRVYIAVVGPGTDAAPQTCALAREVGRLLAERGTAVLTGGLGGVMAAAAQGVAAAGGLSIGLLPGNDRGAGNAGSTLLIATGLGELRNAVLVTSADGIVAVGGSWATLSEIALARRTGVPVVCIDGWTVRAADGSALQMHSAASPAAAVGRVLELVAARSEAAAAQRPAAGKMDR
jgi:uncharacterized protein (TIGR00725 family)